MNACVMRRQHIPDSRSRLCRNRLGLLDGDGPRESWMSIWGVMGEESPIRDGVASEVVKVEDIYKSSSGWS